VENSPQRNGTSLAEIRFVSRRVIALHPGRPSHSEFAVFPHNRERLVAHHHNEDRRQFASGVSQGSVPNLRRDRIECSERRLRKT